jgi:hypothetical protein
LIQRTISRLSLLSPILVSACGSSSANPPDAGAIDAAQDVAADTSLSPPEAGPDSTTPLVDSGSDAPPDLDVAMDSTPVPDVSPGDGGAITEFPLPSILAQPNLLTSGPDGNVWFTDDNGAIGKATVAGVITEFPIPQDASSVSFGGITSGADGNVWFTKFSTQGSTVGKMTPAGTLTEFPIDSSANPPQAIAWGTDGNLWFGGAYDKIARMTT